MDEIRWFKNNRQADLFAIYSIIYYIYTHIYGDHGDNKLHISQNISATAFFCCFHHITYIVISHIVISHVTFYIFQSFYNIIENTLMKVGSPVDVPTTVSMLIYIHKESQVSISALVQQ